MGQIKIVILINFCQFLCYIFYDELSITGWNLNSMLKFIPSSVSILLFIVRQCQFILSWKQAHIEASEDIEEEEEIL